MMIVGAVVAALLACKVHSGTSTDTTKMRQVFDQTRARLAEYERDHGHFAEVNGIRLHYLEWGSPQGMPLVWAHGSASTGYELRHVAEPLAKAGYRVLAVDYRGHGLTRVTSYDFTIYDIADDLVALLDKLGARRAVFGGASKGGFIAAAVYDQHPTRVAGLLLADGGSWSNQWLFDHDTTYVRQERARMQPGAGPPRIVEATQFAVFEKLTGGAFAAGRDVPVDRALDLVSRIIQSDDGRWAFIPGFERMMGMPETYVAGMTAPTTLPPLQWSQHVMNPLAVFRRLDVPMMILDPQNASDELPVTDQNQRLAALHPKLIVHRIYAETGHAVVALRPDWFVRDATELLARARAKSAKP